MKISDRANAFARVALGWAMLFALAFPIPSWAQCPWNGPAMCTLTTAPYEECYRSLTATQTCQAPVNAGNGTVCSPAVTTSAVVLRAYQSATSLQPTAYCDWQCGGVSCRIQLADGLPVELLEFSIEGGVTQSGESTEGDQGRER